jgi:hypothetical protein
MKKQLIMFKFRYRPRRTGFQIASSNVHARLDLHGVLGSVLGDSTRIVNANCFAVQYRRAVSFLIARHGLVSTLLICS